MAGQNKVKRVGRQMTTRQVALVKKLLEGRTIRETVRKVSFSDKKLARLGRRKREAIQLKATELLDEGGLKLEEFIKNHLIPQLSATKKKVFRYKGKITEVYEIPDHRARLTALRTAFWLHGALPSGDPDPDEQKGMKIIVPNVPKAKPDMSAVDRLPPPPPPLGTRS